MSETTCNSEDIIALLEGAGVDDHARPCVQPPAMWAHLWRVDWARLSHAHGSAHDTPRILQQLISCDAPTRERGWDDFWGSLNHQGAYYDSTVAAVPFLIEAVAFPDTPERVQILDYLRDRWLYAARHGGDPLMGEPPGGQDIPTPLRSGALEDPPVAPVPRREALCAWQTGRAILAGRATFEQLLEDPDGAVAAAAAALLLLWRETRARAKQVLIRAVAAAPTALEQSRQILELGVYVSAEDEPVLAQWVAAGQPPAVRAAAALVWAWLADPGALPEAPAQALEACADALAFLPWVGVFSEGPAWLPGNIATFILQLADSPSTQLRWQAVQALTVSPGAPLAAARVVPVLLAKLAAERNRIRAAALSALLPLGEGLLDIAPGASATLIRLLHAHGTDEGEENLLIDSATNVRCLAARLLVPLSHRLSLGERQAAVSGVDLALRRCDGRNDYVGFNNLLTQAAPFLQAQRARLAAPHWELSELFAVFAAPDREDNLLSPGDCDRRLGEAWRRDPRETLAGTLAILSRPPGRLAALGAALWLTTLGPAAAPALASLDALACRSADPAVRERAASAAGFIRECLGVTPDPCAQGSQEPPASAWASRLQALRARLLRGERGSVAALLLDADACVRVMALEALALLTVAAREAARPALEQLLTQSAHLDVGIAGDYWHQGRLYHWRRERRSPRAGALRALLDEGPPLAGGARVLEALLAEAVEARVVCGPTAVPQTFTLAQWRTAAQAAGGFAAVEPRMRTVQQRCQEAGSAVARACATELAHVIRRLCGKRGP